MADDQEGGQQAGYQLKEQHYYKVVSSYMPESFEHDAIQISLIAVDKYKQLKDIAFHIKHEYDKKYPGSGKATEGVYHCIVGKSFASKAPRAGSAACMPRGVGTRIGAPRVQELHIFVACCCSAL